MGIMWVFAPFVLFVIVERLFGQAPGLVTATAVSGALLVRDRMSRGKAVKVLEVGTFLLFGGLAAYAWATGTTWPLVGVRLRVDAGLLLIVLVSIAIRRPFTLQYAREQVAPETANGTEFIRTNYVITAAWALAFVVMVLADLMLLYAPNLPPRVGIIVTILALVGAVKFTAWYPERGQTKAHRQSRVGWPGEPQRSPTDHGAGVDPGKFPLW